MWTIYLGSIKYSDKREKYIYICVCVCVFMDMIRRMQWPDTQIVDNWFVLAVGLGSCCLSYADVCFVAVVKNSVNLWILPIIVNIYVCIYLLFQDGFRCSFWSGFQMAYCGFPWLGPQTEINKFQHITLDAEALPIITCVKQ